LLSAHTINLVKSTIPLLENAGTAVTEHFYRRMFEHNPELLDIFNMSNQASGRQQFALFNAVAAYAKNIEQPQVLLEAVERIAHKHASMLIQPEHYPIVGGHLLATLKELAPDAFSAEIEQAWAEAYEFLANIFIQREQALYNQNSEKTGGWSGSRRFYLAERYLESELVCSFIFKPVDAQGVCDYSPGQYLGIKVAPDTSDYTEIRQYSLSDKANGEYYRISVKRELGDKPGLVSNYLHDKLEVGHEVEIMPPAGDFLLQQNDKPLVLISAGVGITPMMSMLETLVGNQTQQDIHFLHACESQQQHSFRDRLATLDFVTDKLRSITWYQHPTQPLTDNQFQGFMQLEGLELPEDGHYYLCGPVAFMGFAKQQLLTLGIDSNQIHYEVFGPHSEL